MILNKGNTQTLVNNNGKIDYNNTNWNASYDGKVADIDITTNTNGNKDIYLLQLDNNDLQKMFSAPSDTIPIDQRLLKDYPHTHSSKHRIQKKGKNNKNKSKNVRFKTPTPYHQTFAKNEIISPRTNEIFVFENNGTRNKKKTKKLRRKYNYKPSKKSKNKSKR
jgi:hypothetical protein